MLSHDTSSCSCSVVASPPSDAMLAFLCVSTGVMRASVCLLCVSAVNHRRVAVVHVCALRLSFAVCICCVVVVRRALVCTCMVSLSSRCDLRDRRCVTGVQWDDGVR